MKVFRLVGSLALLYLISPGIETNAQQKFRTTSASVIGYLEYLPDDYNSNSNKYPLVVFLHGIGERGPNTTDTTILKQYIQSVTKHGPPKHVQNGTKFPFILISPQLKNSYSTWPSAYVMEVLEHCKKYLRVDERRIIITGLSLGGGGTWMAAQDYPEFFAAVAPVCGGYNSPTKACGIASENLPVWAFHGDKDTVVPLSKSKTMVDAINACTPKPSPLAQLTVYPGVGHNAWDYAYRTDHSLHNPNIYEWMMSFTNEVNKGNRIPIANAGTDKSVTVRSLSLPGSATDADGSVVSYSWTKLTGPAATLGNTSSATLSLSNLEIGTYMFRLRASDNSGNTDSDYIRVTVKNAVPIANAGTDKEITLPVNSVILSATATDADGSITSWQWSQVSGPEAVLTNAATPTATASNLTEGLYVFRVRATDNNGASDTDDVTLTVKEPALPVVNAGADKLVRLPTTSATLKGSATDPDGTISSYLWTKLSGGTCAMYYTTTASLKINKLQSGTYAFRLTVLDNHGNSASDDVLVIVDAPPVANAGPDKSIILPLTAPLVLSGSATDVDGTVVKYQWSKHSGPNVSLSNNTTSSLSITKVYAGTYVFRLAVTDNVGVVGYDYVTVTVTDPVISGSARQGTADETYSEAELKKTEEADSDLAGSMVMIYNEYGQKVYDGNWSADTESEVMKAGGLYIYRIVRNGVTIRSGKIFRKNI